MQQIVTSIETRPSLFRPLSNFLLPSLSDFLFFALMFWLFASGSGWSVLLADGDTGWHIRTGEFILNTGSVPSHDLFSFSKAGEPWFAWEWLSDVCFALLHRQAGLKGIVFLTGLVLSLSAIVLFHHMLWRGANILFALLTTLLAVGASGVHYLARPHIFTFLFLSGSLWLLDRDRQNPSRAVWWLVPLSAIWTNMHGGFLSLIACLALITIASGVKAVFLKSAQERPYFTFRRYSALTTACSLATLLNPYGYQLHLHVAQFLRSDWIRESVEEFQSPKFRSESMLQFEALLFLALSLSMPLLRKRNLEDVAKIVFWAQAALASVRHVPIFAIVAAPVLAAELTLLWDRWSEEKPRRSLAGTLREIVEDFSSRPQRSCVWAPVLLATLLFFDPRQNWPTDFPENKFPVAAVNRNAARLGSRGPEMPRILTSDQWGDYLIYRFYPDQKVFVDGRSDFYGPGVGGQYLDVLNAQQNWASIIDRYRFNLALIPVKWPVAAVLRNHPDWRVRYEDAQAILFERGGDAIPAKPPKLPA